MRLIYAFILLTIISPSCLAAEEFNLDDINAVRSRAAEMGKKITVPENSNKEKGAEMARDSFKVYQSESFQNKLKAEMDRIQQHIQGFGEQKYYAGAKKLPKGVLSNEQIYIFISSSMPESTIRHYIQDVDYLNDPNIKFVLRGFVDGVKKIRPTMNFIRNVMKKDPTCTGKCEKYKISVQVNPVLFSRFNIEAVPAILYVQGKLPTEASRLKTVSPPNWLIYGDASLETAAEIFADKINKASLRELNRKLRKIDGYVQSLPMEQ
jgi:type-F conjugative transfer system pilin assembly protein TrbC